MKKLILLMLVLLIAMCFIGCKKEKAPPKTLPQIDLESEEQLKKPENAPVQEEPEKPEETEESESSDDSEGTEEEVKEESDDSEADDNKSEDDVY